MLYFNFIIQVNVLLLFQNQEKNRTLMLLQINQELRREFLIWLKMTKVLFNFNVQPRQFSIIMCICVNFIFCITENKTVDSSENTLEVQVVTSSNEHIKSLPIEKANFDIPNDHQTQSDKVEGYFFHFYQWSLEYSLYNC